jgi:hypothetical protein
MKEKQPNKGKRRYIAALKSNRRNAKAQTFDGTEQRETSMLNTLIRFSLTHRSLVLAMSLVVLLYGEYASTTMPIDRVSSFSPSAPGYRPMMSRHS